MSEYWFPIKPKGKARPRVTARGTYMPPEYTKYKDELKKMAFKKGYKIDPENLNISFFFKPPKTQNKKVLKPAERTALIGKFHKAKPDLDNLIGAFMDALLEDDSSVCSIKAEKVYGHAEGILIEIED